MSGAVAWLTEAKSYEITGANILFSAFVAALLLGFSFGVRLDRAHRHDTLLVQGKIYQADGFVQMEDHGRKLFLPFYQEAHP